MLERSETQGHQGAVLQRLLGSRSSRRDLLRRAVGLGLAAPVVSGLLAACGGEEGTASTPSGGGAQPAAATPTSAPNVLQGTELTVLFGTFFVPETQDLMREQLEEWGRENGVRTAIDFVNWPDLQPKISAAVQAGAGPDIVQFWPGWAYLYRDSLVEVNDLAEKVVEAEGDYFEWAVKTVRVDDTWLSIPIGTSTGAQVYRISFFQEAGWDDPVNNPPDTWEDIFKIGVELKKRGTPLGQAFGHSTGDPPGFCYAFMWAYGAMEVEDDGTTVAFNKPQFVDGMKLFLSYWPLAFDETGLSWDDATNNRAFLAGQIAWTFNGSSISIAAQKDAPEIAEDIMHHIYPQGPAGRFNNLGSQSVGIMSYSKNVEGAKAFLEWWRAPEQFRRWLEIQKGYQLAPTPFYLEDPYYTEDPKLKPYAEVGKYGRNIGYTGPTNEKAAEAFARYIVVDTFARAIQSGDADEAIQWGASELERIYGG